MNANQEDFSKYNGEGTTLRKAQLRMLEILIEVDKICKKHNIQYWLDFGTLLGAVRHGGFIPWDDDLDITVMRKDYKRLRKVLQEELPEQFVFQDWTTEKYYPCSFGKVRDKKSQIIDPLWKDEVKEKGIYIDIFPIEKGYYKFKRIFDPLYNGVFMRKQRHLKCSKGVYLLACAMWPITLCVKSLLRFFVHASSPTTYIYSYGVTVYPSQIEEKYIFPLKNIFFEGMEFPVASNPDAYLKKLFGNYMQIPPVEERRQHAINIIVN